MHVLLYVQVRGNGVSLTTLHKAMPFTGLPGQACTKYYDFWHYTMTDINNGIQGQQKQDRCNPMPILMM